MSERKGSRTNMIERLRLAEFILQESKRPEFKRRPITLTRKAEIIGERDGWIRPGTKIPPGLVKKILDDLGIAKNPRKVQAAFDVVARRNGMNQDAGDQQAKSEGGTIEQLIIITARLDKMDDRIGQLIDSVNRIIGMFS